MAHETVRELQPREIILAFIATIATLSTIGYFAVSALIPVLNDILIGFARSN